MRAKEIPLEILRQPKAAKNEEIIPFIITYSCNNPNVFPIIKQTFYNFQYSKTRSNIFQRKKSMSQALNLLKGYSVDLNLNHSPKITELKVERIASSFKSILISI